MAVNFDIDSVPTRVPPMPVSTGSRRPDPSFCARIFQTRLRKGGGQQLLATPYNH
jgi:hypothetical protein